MRTSSRCTSHHHSSHNGNDTNGLTPDSPRRKASRRAGRESKEREPDFRWGWTRSLGQVYYLCFTCSGAQRIQPACTWHLALLMTREEKIVESYRRNSWGIIVAMYIIQHYHGGTFSTFEKNMFELKRVSISMYCDIFFCKSRYDIDFYTWKNSPKLYLSLEFYYHILLLKIWSSR